MTSRKREVYDVLVASGYVSTEDACKAVNRSISGSSVQLLRKSGVDFIQLGTGTSPFMWKKADLVKVPVSTRGGKPNGAAPSMSESAIADRVDALELRIAVVESLLDDYFPDKPEGSKQGKGHSAHKQG
jgi:hypothetical protein